MLSIREYANSIGISYEAVRRKVLRYAEELEGHTTVSNRRTYLDDYAVEFLNQHRNIEQVGSDPVQVVSDPELQAEIESLKSQLIAMQSKIISLQDEKSQFLLESAEMKQARMDLERLQEVQHEQAEEMKRLQEENASLKQSLEKKQESIDSYNRLSMFQRILKKIEE